MQEAVPAAMLTCVTRFAAEVLVAAGFTISELETGILAELAFSQNSEEKCRAVQSWLTPSLGS